MRLGQRIQFFSKGRAHLPTGGCAHPCVPLANDRGKGLGEESRAANRRVGNLDKIVFKAPREFTTHSDPAAESGSWDRHRILSQLAATLFQAKLPLQVIMIVWPDCGGSCRHPGRLVPTRLSKWDRQLQAQGQAASWGTCSARA